MKIDSERILIILILILGFILRVSYLNFLLPYLEFQDERMVVETALKVLKHHDLNPHFFKYGSFPIYLTSFIYLVYFFFLRLVSGPESLGTLIGSFGYYDHGLILYRLGRYLSVGFGLGTIFLVYLIGKKMGGKRVGLLSAFFTAMLPYHILFSQIFKVDISLMFWILLSFYFSCRVLEEGRFRDYLAAGAAAGLALATKYNFFTIVPLLLASIIYRKGWRGVFNLKLLLAVYIAGMVFLITCPFALLDFHTFWDKLRYLMGFEEKAVLAFHLDSSRFFGRACIFQFCFLLPAFAGPFLSLAAAGGTYFSLKRDWRWGLFFLVFPVLYFLFSCGVSELTIPAYILPVIPFVLLLGSGGICALWDDGKIFPRVLGGVLGGGVLLFALSNLFIPHFGSYYRVHDQATAWAEANIPAGKTVLSYWGHASTGKFSFKEINFASAMDLKGEDLTRDNPDYVVLEKSKLFTNPRFEPAYGPYARLLEKLEKGELPGFKLVKVFAPPRIWRYFSSWIYPEMEGAILIFAKI